jgi:CDP-4-dehydro-6-deoxyglucose reductase
MIPAQPFNARLVATRRLTPSVRELVFEHADAVPFVFAPGQWVNLVLPLPDGEMKRAHSIASAPVAGSPRFELAVTLVEGGPGSQYLHRIKEGEMLRAIGPHGLFTRDAEATLPSLFVATGTGVTPFRSMIQAALRDAHGAPLWLLFGARHEEDILYQEELTLWAREHPNLRYEITLSRPTSEWTGRRGYVQHHASELLRELRAISGEAEPHAYVCGLDRMVSAVKDLLRNELSLPRKHVHTERYD